MSEDEYSTSDEHCSEEEDEKDNENVNLPTHHPYFPCFSSSPADPNEPTIHTLHDDCLHLILDHLDIVEVMQLATVCRRWYNLCLTKMGRISEIALNPTFSIFRLNTPLCSSSFLSVLSLTKKSLTSLDLSNSSLKLDRATLSVLPRLAPNLTHLNLSKMKINNKIASCFAKSTPPKLKKLNLNGCVSFKEKCLEHVLRNASQLEQLDISYCHKVTGSSIMKHLPKNNMTHFTLTECFRLKPAVFQFILFNYSETLQYLDVTLCGRYTLSLSKNQFRSMSALKVLKAKDFPSTSEDRKLPHLMRHMPNLEELDLEFNTEVGQKLFMDQIVVFCPLLRTVDFSECHPADPQVFSSLKLLKHLTNLKLDRLGTLDDEGYEELTNSVLVHCSNLTSLSLQSGLTADQEVFSLLTTLPKLRSLDLRSTPFPLDGTFIYLCRDLVRSVPVKIYAQDTALVEGEYEVPASLDVLFGLPNLHSELFSDPGDRYDDLLAFEHLDLGWDLGYEGVDELEGRPPSEDEEEFWEGGYIEEAVLNARYGNEIYAFEANVDDDNGIYNAFEAIGDDDNGHVENEIYAFEAIGDDDNGRDGNEIYAFEAIGDGNDEEELW